MIEWSIHPLHLELKFNWEIARGATSEKVNYIVKANEGELFGEGEMAGLTGRVQSEEDVVREFESLPLGEVQDPLDCEELQVSEPLRFAISSALVRLRCAQAGKTLAEFLNQPEQPMRPTSFSIPLMPIEKVRKFIVDYKVEQYPACKIKVGKDHKVDHCLEVAKWFKGPLRIDANESLNSAEEVLGFLNELQHLPVEFVEQPMPAALKEEYRQLKKRCKVPIVADESLQRETVISDLVDQFHGINVKLMKSGSLHKAVQQLETARRLGLKTMLGCMVETQLSIDCAHAIGSEVDWIDLDGHLFLKSDPYFSQESP